MKGEFVQRADIWWARLEPLAWRESGGMDLVIVVSNDAANRHMDRVQVVPLATRAGSLYPCEAVVTMGRHRQAKAVADQITTISKQQLEHRAGRIGQKDMANLDRAISLQLALTHLTLTHLNT